VSILGYYISVIEPILSKARESMRRSLSVMQQDLSSIRSGRATPALVENIVIAAYGGTQRLKIMEMATITSMDTKTLVIAPYDPSQIGDIEKGIQQAQTGLTPVVDGDIIRISIPPLSEERRHEYIRLAKAKLEAGRVNIRQVRADAMKDLKKLEEEKQISQDEQKHGERLVQELTDDVIGEIDMLGKKKEEELLQV
jgi:ribosome recycling factor